MIHGQRQVCLNLCLLQVKSGDEGVDSRWAGMREPTSKQRRVLSRVPEGDYDGEAGEYLDDRSSWGML